MRESIQKRISRIRPPRVQVTYELEIGDALVLKELPCIVGVIADATGGENPHPYQERKFVYIDQDNFNEVLKSFKPVAEVKFTINGVEKSQTLSFSSIDDFNPLFIIKQIEELNSLYDIRVSLSDLRTKISNNVNLYKKINDSKKEDISKIVEEFAGNKDDLQKNYFTNTLNNYYSIEEKKDNPIDTIQNKILQIDTIINSSLDEILHSPSLQKIEGTWRGLFYLVKNSEIGEGLKIRILNASKKEIYDDISRALDIEQTFLFQKIYEEEFGTFGGNPYSFFILDNFIGRNQQDFALLNLLSSVAAAPHTPILMGGESSIFDIDSYEDLYKIRDLKKVFSSPELSNLRSFRENEDSKYVAIVLPRVMGRIPYGPKTSPIEGLNYQEKVDKHSDFLWTNSSYVYGQKIAESFSKHGWFTSMCGVENGGMVNNLPVFTEKTQDGDYTIKCPTETAITDRREKELADLGFIPLCYCKDTDYAVFFSGQSLNKAPLYDKEEANANARLTSSFQNILNASRFAQYLKCIVRDKIGSFATKDNLKEFLSRWISHYVLLNDNAPQEVKQSYPLRNASIDVSDFPGRPGCFKARVLLQPMSTIQEVVINISLVDQIQKSK